MSNEPRDHGMIQSNPRTNPLFEGCTQCAALRSHVLHRALNGGVGVGLSDGGVLDGCAELCGSEFLDFAHHVDSRVLLVALRNDALIAKSHSLEILADLVDDPLLGAALVADCVAPDTRALRLLHDQDSLNQLLLGFGVRLNF